MPADVRVAVVSRGTRPPPRQQQAGVGGRAAAVVVCVCFCAGATLQLAGRPAAEPCPPAASAPAAAPAAAPAVVRRCAPGERVSVRVPDGAELDVASGLIARFRPSRYGGGGRWLAVEGLLDAFAGGGGLLLSVGPETLGGAPLPHGLNVLEAEFVCGAPAAAPSLVPALPAAVRRRWAAGDPSADPCSKATEARRGPALPKTAACSTAAACAGVYEAVQQHAAAAGLLPGSPADAVACAVRGVAEDQSVAALAEFARRHHAVWLVRVLGTSVEWAPQGRPQDWRAELQGFSILQLHIERIAAAIEDAGLRFASPVYLLLNALDKPHTLLRHPSPTGVGCDHSGVLRSGHQFECVTGAAWMKNRTQWGGDELLLPAAQQYAYGSGIPLLSWSVVPGWHADVLSPNRHPGSCHRFFRSAALSAVPWAAKEDRLLFRAFSAACDRSSNGPRQKAVCWAERQNGQIVAGGRRIALDIGGGRGYGPTGSQRYLTPARQAAAKYLLLFDGVVAAFRSTWLLQTGSVVLAAGAWADVRTQLLRPWVHYVPISSDLSDLVHALSVLAANDTFAEWIASNALKAAALLSGQPEDGGDSFDKLYYTQLLQGLSQRVRYSARGAESVVFTNDRQCGSWKRTRGRVRQCLPSTYACGGAAAAPERVKVDKFFFQGNG
eukprot:TRINITY_DN32488_c0_g1_i1.p1 TRINITY_DN32488_c0_g1~~TRINITY_DN32488_c0_g1_i1.p1  ORF type:complete len:682 (+),score=220.28 TRINITY_DN32488_c0_g1_i1:50-2047(+)